MFVRIKERGHGKRVVQIVESIRQGDKVRQKVFRHVGQGLTEQEVQVLKGLAESIIVEHKNAQNPVLPGIDPNQFYAPVKRKRNLNAQVCMGDLREEKRISNGVVDVFGKLYDELGFTSIIRNTRKNRQWNTILKACVLARVATPLSKRATSFLLERDYDIYIPYEKLYDMMDHLFKQEKRVKKLIAQNTLDLFQQAVDILFFDVTTLYFESTEQDELRDFGFSKDCKFKEVQVMLALVTTTDGHPVDYRLFPGNTYEGHTLIDMAKALKSQYQVNDILLVADRAMFNEANLTLMDKEGLQYIVAAKLKSMSKIMKTQILNNQGYRGEVICHQFHWANEFEHKNRRLIVSYSSKRAKKDAADRHRLVERLLKKVNDGKLKIKELIPNYGTKKYLQITGGEARVNEAKISEDAQWDGLHGVVTNCKTKQAGEILSRYRQLWQIEESFRVNKHNLKMRPIYHWRPNRIRAHISICFIAYSMIRHVEHKMRDNHFPMSIDTIRDELRHVQSSIVVDQKTKQHYVIPSKSNSLQQAIYRCFGIKRALVPYAID